MRDYLKLFRAVCTAHECDCDCPLFFCCPTRGAGTTDDTKRALEKWAEEQRKTRLTEFAKLFPDAVYEGAYPALCVSYLSEAATCDRNCDKCRREYWEAEI